MLALALPWSADQEWRAESRWLAQLSATADDRLVLVEDWISARERDAATIAGYPTAGFVAHAQGPTSPAPAGEDPRLHLEDILRGVQRTHGYDALWLASPEGTVLAATTSAPVDAALVAEAIAKEAPVVGFSADRRVLVAAPLPTRPPRGAIVLSADPGRLLFPLLRRETAPTRSGTCALVTREAGDVVYLSPLRDRPAGWRVPVSRAGTAAAVALGGAPRAGRFDDERGRAVLAAVRPVAGRPWGLLVRIERDEALGPTRTEIRRTIAVAAALVAALAGVGVLWWRQQTISSRLAVARADARLARLLRALSAVNQLIAREPDRQRFLREACHLVVQEGGFLLAWIGFRDPETEWLVPAASAGDDGYLTETWMSADPSLEQGLGPTGVAVREGRTVVIRDVEAESTAAPWRTEALARGIRSIVATPVRAHGAVVGSLAVYAGQAGAFDPEATHLVERIATDVGFATEAAEARREKERAVLALAQSKASLEAVVANSPAAIITVQPDGRIGDIWNRAAERIFGWSRSEVIGRVPPYVPPRRPPNRWRCASGCSPARRSATRR
ncbi:MAG: GAF domain-containing protein [Vicinamibacteria bacterium]